MPNNNSNNHDDVSILTERATAIFSATQAFMMAMQLGDRMPIKEMATKIGPSINMEPAQVLPYVNDFAHNTNLGGVSAGRFGGFIRGSRLKTVKGKSSIETTETPESIVESIDLNNSTSSN